MVGRDGVREPLEDQRLAGARRRDDQAALAEADRRDQVDHARDEVVGRLRAARLELELAIGVDRRERLEVDERREVGRRLLGDLLDAQQREVALVALRPADLAADRHPRLQVVLGDERGREVDVIGDGR
jgi:hypothetical protein